MTFLIDTFWLLSYLIGFFGSVSFGYLVLRFSLPDIRAAPEKAKLGFSFVLGFIFFGIAFGMTFLFGSASLFAFLPVFAFIAVGIFTMKDMLLPRKTMSIALPVVSVAQPGEARLAAIAAEPSLPAGVMEKCPKCKAKVLPEDSFCGSCGASIYGE